jgi:hypothetical protein
MRIFRADTMGGATPFAESREIDPVFVKAGIAYVDDPTAADLIVARSIAKLEGYRHSDRTLVVWTHEPRISLETEPLVWPDGFRSPVHIMNAYTGGIYTDEFYCFSTARFFNFDQARPDFERTMQSFKDKPRRAVMLASYRRPPSPVTLNGVDCDLQQYRQRLARLLQDRGFCDIYGRNWPKDVSITGNTRVGDWRPQKMEVLRSYAINLAFENTIIKNYVTEKLWEAIAGICLPVYHGGNGIDRIFPSGSFIDARGKSVEALGEKILAMSREDMAEHYAACLRAYIGIFDSDRREVSRRACSERTVKFLEGAIAAHAAHSKRFSDSLWRRAELGVRLATGEVRRAMGALSALASRERRRKRRHRRRRGFVA